MRHPNQGHMDASVCPSSCGERQEYTLDWSLSHHRTCTHSLSPKGSLESLCPFTRQQKRKVSLQLCLLHKNGAQTQSTSFFKKRLQSENIIVFSENDGSYGWLPSHTCGFVVAPPTKCGLAASLRWHAEAHFFIHHRPNQSPTVHRTSQFWSVGGSSNGMYCIKSCRHEMEHDLKTWAGPKRSDRWQISE